MDGRIHNSGKINMWVLQILKWKILLWGGGGHSAKSSDWELWISDIPFQMEVVD